MSEFAAEKSLLTSQIPYDIDLSEIVDRAITAGIKTNQADLSLTDNDKHYLMDAAQSTLENYFSDSPEITAADFTAPPGNLLNQSEKIYTTLYANGKIRGCQSASKGNLLENTISAVRRTIEDERFGGTLKKEERPRTAVDFTFLLKPTQITEHDLEKLDDKIELGIHAISLQMGRKRAFYNISVPVTH